MKKLALLSILSLTLTINANQKAITGTGKEVILNDNGTWSYADKTNKISSVIKLNKSQFIKGKNDTFLVKSTINDFAIYINPKKWSFLKTKGEDIEYDFQLKGNDLYGMVITERIEIPVESLAEIGLENTRNVAPDIKVQKKEYRIVNGKKVIYMEMSGTVNGIKFTYFGYYYSDSSGSTQLLVYTGTSLTKKYKPAINNFLNGLVTQKL